MLSAAYTDPRLVAVYDTFNPWSADCCFYLDLAGGARQSVLDVGCGTGLLACAFAAGGHRVAAADPSAEMLDYARCRPGGSAVDWILTDAANLAVEERFELVTMTGHVFQVFLDDSDIRAALDNLRGHLAPGGRIAFETRNPAVSAWLDWTQDRSTRRAEVPGLGQVEVYNQLTSTVGNRVTFDTVFRLADVGTMVTSNTLRFTAPSDLQKLLAASGFEEVEWFGGWDRSQLHAGSQEIVVVATGP